MVEKEPPMRLVGRETAWGTAPELGQAASLESASGHTSIRTLRVSHSRENRERNHDQRTLKDRRSGCWLDPLVGLSLVR